MNRGSDVTEGGTTGLARLDNTLHQCEIFGLDSGVNVVPDGQSANVSYAQRISILKKMVLFYLKRNHVKLSCNIGKSENK